MSGLLTVWADDLLDELAAICSTLLVVGHDLTSLGADAPIQTWPARRGPSPTQGVLATRPVVTAGVGAWPAGALYAGSQWLRTAAFAAAQAQPLSVIAVHQRTGAIGGTSQFVHDGSSGDRVTLFHAATTGNLTMAALTSLIGSASTSLGVTRAAYNGASSELWRNGALIAGPGNAGTQTMPVLTLGADNVGGRGLVGPVYALGVVPSVGAAALRAEAIMRALTGV